MEAGDDERAKQRRLKRDYSGPIDRIQRERNTLLARRHCGYPGCGKIIKSRYWSGFCRKHWPIWLRERNRIANARWRDRKRLEKTHERVRVP